MEIQRQAIFNVDAIRFAIYVRQNLRHLPPEMQANFLMMSDFIQEFEHEPDGDKKESTDTERDLAN